MEQVILSVIIVNYNGMPYLKGCLDAIALQLQGILHEVVVIDNNSSDGSCAYIQQQYPEVVLIPSSENLGFGKGNNAAVKKAKGEYILLLNNDTILQNHLAPALAVLKADPKIGALGIYMLDGNRAYIKPGGRFPSVANLYRIKNMGMMGPEFAGGGFSKPLYEMEWLSGSFMLMPKRVYNEVGGFDEDYFMYVEDVDLCKKIADAGYRRVFMPGLSYIHFVGYNSTKDPLIIQGLEMYVSKHSQGLKRWLMQCALGFNKLVKKVKKLKR